MDFWAWLLRVMELKMAYKLDEKNVNGSLVS